MATTHDSSGAADRGAATPGAPAGRDLFLTEICESPSALLGTARTLGEQADKFEAVRTCSAGRRLAAHGSAARPTAGAAVRNSTRRLAIQPA